MARYYEQQFKPWRYPFYKYPANPDSFRGYGDMDYGHEPYGEGYIKGLQPRQLVLYYSNSDGTIDWNHPITFVPPYTVDWWNYRTVIPTFTLIGETFMTNIKKLKPKHVWTSYHKIWIANHSDYDAQNIQIGVDANVDTEGFMELAPEVYGGSLPTGDENFIRTGSYGPVDPVKGELFRRYYFKDYRRKTVGSGFEFLEADPLYLYDLNRRTGQEGAYQISTKAFWIKRQVTAVDKDPHRLFLPLIILADTEAEGEQAIYFQADKTEAPNKVYLTAPMQDQTMLFTADKVFEISHTSGNNGSCVVFSSSYVGGKTVITINPSPTIPSPPDDLLTALTDEDATDGLFVIKLKS